MASANIVNGASIRQEEPPATVRRKFSSHLPMKSVEQSSAPPRHLASPPQDAIRPLGGGHDLNKRQGRVGSRARGKALEGLYNPPTRHAPSPAMQFTVTHTLSTTPRLSPGQPQLLATRQDPRPTPPSLMSSTPISAQDTSKSNTLRRKPSAILGNYISQRRARAPPKTDAPPLPPEAAEDNFVDSVLGISFPQSSNIPRVAEVPVVKDHDSSMMGLQYRSHAVAQNSDPKQPRTPFSEPSATPSTRFNDSPGAFSHATSATSQTSYSPLMSASPFSELGSLRRNPKINLNNHAVQRETPVRIEKEMPMTMPLQQSSSASMGTSTTSKLPSRQKSAVQKTTSHSGSTQPSRAQGKCTIPPPELAHLLEEPFAARRANITPPRRPSRDGTSDLAEVRTVQPVVQSSLQGISTPYQQRSGLQGGIEFESTREGPGVQSEIEAPSRRLSRTVPPQASVSRLSYSRPMTPKLQAGPNTQLANADLNSKSPQPPVRSTPSPSKFGARFGLFSKRNRSDGDAVVEDSPKSVRKGPAAGTGHEGYGKPAVRSRHGFFNPEPENAAHVVSGRENSMHMLTGQSRGGISGGPQLESLPARRINQNHVRHNSGISDRQFHLPADETNHTSSSRSSVNDAFHLLSSASSPRTAQTSQSSIDLPKQHLKSSAIPKPATSGTFPARIMHSPRESMDRSESDGSPSKPIFPRITSPLAPRPSGESTLSRSATSSSNPRSPKAYQETYQESHGASLQSIISQTEHMPQTKKSSWAFLKSFQRKPPQKDSNVQQTLPSLEDKEAAVDVSAHIPAEVGSKFVAHYAMDEVDDPIGFEELDLMMREADDARRQENLNPFGWASNITFDSLSSPDQPYPAFPPFMSIPPQTALQNPMEPSVIPEPTVIPEPVPSEPKHRLEDSPLLEPTVKARPNRLVEVGRIPKVVSRRDRDRQLPEQSFSRPFASSQPRPENGNIQSTKFMSQLSSGIHSNSPGEGNQPNSSAQPNERQLARQNKTPHIVSVPNPSEPTSGAEFLSFAPRIDSDLSNSSSSGTLYFPTWVPTAVLPTPGSPPSDDEVWREYDDLIDSVLTPNISTTSPFRAMPPAQRDYFTARNATPPSISKNNESGRAVYPRLGAIANSSPSRVLQTASSKDGSSLLNCYDGASSVTTPTSLAGFVAGYGERNLESPATSRLRRSASERNSSSTVRSSLRSRLRTSGSSKHSRSASAMEIEFQIRTAHRSGQTSRTTSQGNSGAQAMANLRFCALMTSKWLSFGRVLFSPGHFELNSLGQDRVLVVDGLGKDWSYYCALTYPDANVYSLGLAPKNSSKRESLSGFQSLPNHRHFVQSDMSSNYPFPKGFFAVVVFRFPVATLESTLRSMLSECKRVLRPGGYLEISTLDLDLMSMGNRARKAVRELKISMQTANPDISLKPPSDNILFLLGRRGFENINRCIVGVPAAGAIQSSRQQSTDVKDMAFTELLKDRTSAGDDGIAKMVSRVAQWWYSRCYETGALPNGAQANSIWNDSELLQECEEMQTTFKLLVCYAQNPTLPTRRTVSI